MYFNVDYANSQLKFDNNLDIDDIDIDPFANNFAMFDSEQSYRDHNHELNQLHLLLHNPKCALSKQYAQQFLEVKTPLSLGIVDCEREIVLCQHLNVTHHPTLAVLTNSSLIILDQQLFLLKQGIIEANNPKLILNGIIRKLKSESGYVAFVLQEEGLPVLQKVHKSQDKNVFYIESPSKLHKLLSNMVGRKLGCWILSKKNNSFDKYYCGNGYRSDQLEKYLQSYQTGRIAKHSFTKQTNSTYIQSAELNQIIKDNGRRYQKCKLIYFYSKECQQCSSKDYPKIQNILASLKINNLFTLQIFDLDIEQLPEGLKLKRVPQLVQFCHSQVNIFGSIFDNKHLHSFLNRDRIKQKEQQSHKNSKLNKTIEQTRKAQQIILQPEQPNTPQL